MSEETTEWRKQYERIAELEADNKCLDESCTAISGHLQALRSLAQAVVDETEQQRIDHQTEYTVDSFNIDALAAGLEADDE